MELTASQFIYAVCHAGGSKAAFVSLPGRCHLCGGELFAYNGSQPGSYDDRVSASWLSEDLARDRDSSAICPACAWMYGQRRTVFQKGCASPAKEDKIVAALNFSAVGTRVVPSGEPQLLLEFLVHPPDPPFVSIAWVSMQITSRRVPFNSRIAWQTSPYPLWLDGSVTWIYPETLGSAFIEYLEARRQGGSPRPEVNTPERWLANKLVGRILWQEKQKRKAEQVN